MRMYPLGQQLVATIRIPTNATFIDGDLTLPPRAKGLVIFAHGSGSDRSSQRNRFVARQLHAVSLATLLIDLFPPGQTSQVFDVTRFTQRLIAATNWAQQDHRVRHLAIGYFGGSTGAAVAVHAASNKLPAVRAIVSRGGRVDIVYPDAQQLAVPTLLIVGQYDTSIRAANEEFFLALKCPKQLALIPHASHLFEEPGALNRVAELSRAWFLEHLSLTSQDTSVAGSIS